ncbi:MAG: undecaprenyldiphospho-muramoylpentapeptide beta-N-acetylglucosaminyltransferase [Deltaproteobacteria bacterium]|nr:undecaprenyldiphospho-muramoylpentapeptide beta-N-acetylglucosaminyltransferase [Deltaproteobacteria bacterium]
MGKNRDSRRSKTDEIRMIIAGGGTGGHLFPGLAVGKEISERFSRSRVLFITGQGGMETDIICRSGFMHESISVEGIKGRGLRKAIIAFVKVPIAIFQSAKIIRRFSPHVVFGVGGYSSGPACFVARIMKVPTAIHEQNTFPGLANRLLSRIVDKVFISFEVSRNHFPGRKILVTGNPIRRVLLEKMDTEEDAKRIFTVLVVGGSQGAIAINRAFLDALEILKKNGMELNIIHQTGKQDFKYVKDQYEKRGFKGNVTAFIEDMGIAYKEAHIVIGRAGASTISELAVLGKPSILIPYPFAADGHQETNARILATTGGAEILLQKDLNGQRLAEILVRYKEDRMALRRMGCKARETAMPYATAVIADAIERMAFKYGGRREE